MSTASTSCGLLADIETGSSFDYEDYEIQQLLPFLVLLSLLRPLLFTQFRGTQESGFS